MDNNVFGRAWLSDALWQNLEHSWYTALLIYAEGKHHRIDVRCENHLVKDSNGKRRVTTVLIDEITFTTDITKQSIMVVGRSPARDIIDSTWSDVCGDQTLRAITRYIGNKFNIVCDTFPVDQPDPTEMVYAFSWESESPWTKLIGEADSQGYIFTSNEAGNLYLWKVAAAVRSEPFNITEGVNIKSVRWTENGSEQFHEYVVGGGTFESRIIDGSCPGSRVLTIDISDPFVAETKLKRRAETEMRRRRENKTIVSVSGWGLTDDQIKSLGNVTRGKEVYWVPNLLIPVKVPSFKLNANLLISEVEYTATPDTAGCDLTLVNREAYL